MNWWRAPENGPLNPNALNRRTKSQRLQGFHRFKSGPLVQIYAGQDGEGMAKFQTQQNPVFQGRTQFVAAFGQGRSKGQNSFARGYVTGESPILQLLTNCQSQCLFHIVGKDESAPPSKNPPSSVI